MQTAADVRLVQNASGRLFRYEKSTRKNECLRMGSQGIEPWTHGLRVRCSAS